MFALLSFIIGLIFGSFLSVVLTRLEVYGAGFQKQPKRGRAKRAAKEIAVGRSRCDHCGKPVAWYDNIPLVSYLLLSGTCRHCGKRISGYHPVLELSSGLMLLAAYLYYGVTWQTAIAAVFGLFMLLIFAYDLRHQIIPDVVVVPAIILSLVVLLYQFVLFTNGSIVQLTLWSPDPWSYVIGAGVLGLFFLALSVASGGKWIGGGDLKLAVLIGLLLGWPIALVAIILAYLIGTLYAVILLLTKRATMKSSIAFGPAMVIGYFVAAFYGNLIVNWYEGLFT